MNETYVRKAAKQAEADAAQILAMPEPWDATRVKVLGEEIGRAGHAIELEAQELDPPPVVPPTEPEPPIEPPYEPPAPPEGGIPPPREVGELTMHVEPGKVTLRDGTVLTSTPLIQNGFGLVEALRRARPGDRIGVRGQHKGFQVGFGDLGKQYVAAWPNGQKLTDVTVVSEGPERAQIRGEVQIDGDVTKAGKGGVVELMFVGFDCFGTRACFIVNQYTHHGRIRWYDLALRSNDAAGYGGYGLKWGIRGHGRCTPDMRKIRAQQAEEHRFGYFDSVGAVDGQDSYFVDLEPLGSPAGRTDLQLVNRADPAQGGGMTGRGNVWVRSFRGNTAPGGGGSSLTVAGHLGTVSVSGFRYAGSLGAIAFWSDAGKGLHKDPNGFTCPRVVLDDIQVDAPSSDRSQIMLTGVGEAELHDFAIKSNRYAVDVNTPTGGPVKTGKLELYHNSAYAGWPQGNPAANPPVPGYKLRVGSKVYTNAEIDALHKQTMAGMGI